MVTEPEKGAVPAERDVEIPHIAPTDVPQRQRAGALLVDVREDAERVAGTPVGARPIPLGELREHAGTDLPRDCEILLLCASGQRSLQAAVRLRDLGYARVASVDGGFRRWQAESLPVTGIDTDADTLDRYARQMRLPQIGAEGQARLANASVAIVGAGGLGSPVALYLAAAGVGHLTLIDDDRVERSNLHRQVLHSDDRVGQSKVDSARAALQALNPQVALHTVHGRIVAANVENWLRGHDVIVDGADNFPTRYLLAAASRQLGLPLVYGAIERFTGQASVFDPRQPDAPCYRCLYPHPPATGEAPNCAEAGVLGVLPGLVGMIQATEALKLLLGIGRPLTGRLLTIDALDMRFRELRLPRDPDCPGCGREAHFDGYEDIAAACGGA